MRIDDIKLTTPQSDARLSQLAKPLYFLFRNFETQVYVFLYLVDSSVGSYVIVLEKSDQSSYSTSLYVDSEENHSMRAILFELLSDFDICPKFQNKAKWVPLPTMPQFVKDKLNEILKQHHLL